MIFPLPCIIIIVRDSSLSRTIIFKIEMKITEQENGIQKKRTGVERIVKKLEQLYEESEKGFCNGGPGCRNRRL